MFIRRFFGIAAIFIALISAAFAELTPVVAPTDLDLPNCQAFAEGKVISQASAATLGWLLGIDAKPNDGTDSWSTGVSQSARARHFRVALGQPRPIGTIVTTYSGGRSMDSLFQVPSGTRVSYLKADAAYPGDVTKDDQWVLLAAGTVKTLPIGTKTRAIRFSEYNDKGTSEFPLAYMFQERYYNPLVLGAEKEIEKAKGQSKIMVQMWNLPQTPVLAGIFITGSRAPSAKVDVLKMTAENHPLVATDAEWSRCAPIATNGPLVYKFTPTIATKAIRISPNGGGLDFAYTMGQAVPLAILGDTPEAPTSAIPPSPVQLKYDMPMDGFIAININDKKTGKQVRRLIAEVPRMSGAVREEWDLKDNNGQYVQPGEYEWHAITRPPLKLTYEMTVNNSGQPAWPSPAPGKGGGMWMADHTPPHAVCAVGDVMFLGSGCAESGHAMVATDLEGNKLWGESNMFGGFLGVRFWAGDNRYGYMINGAGIMRIDTKDELKRQPITLDVTYTRELPGPGSGWGENISGAAVRDGKMYLAYNAPAVSWIQSTFTPGDLDLMKCIPVVRRVRPGRDAYREGEYDEVQQFHSTFLDGAAASCINNSWGSAPKNGPLTGTLTVTFKQPVPIGTVLVQDTNVKVYALKPGKKLPGSIDNQEPGDEGDNVLDEGALSEEDWTPLSTADGKTGQPVLALTEKGLTTTALRFKADRIKYSMVMSHRFKDVAADAARTITDGKLNANGGWQVTRDSKTRPISPYDPACCVLTWKEATSMRGLTMVGMTEAKTAIDYWVGPDDVDPQTAIADDSSSWKQVGIIEAEMNGPYPQTPMARSIDFGENITTRAVRIRAIAPKGDTSYMGNRGVPVTGPHAAGFDYIVVYSNLGGEAELPQELNDRLSIYKLPEDPAKDKATLISHLKFKNPGLITFSPDGTLYAQNGSAIVTVSLPGGERKEVISKDKISSLAGMTFDADGLLYAVDNGPKVVKVFDVKTGTLVRTIGTPGGTKLGSWDPTRFINPQGVTVDKNGKVWVADYDFQPKRISRWSHDGKIEKYFLGPTTYGGGGWLDSGDKNILNFNGMKFVMDWKNRTWKLDSILFRPGLSVPGTQPDRPLYIKGRRYLVGDPDHSIAATICVEKDGIAIPLVMAGNLAGWGAINQFPELQKAYGKLNRGDYGFLWQDANGDAIPQASEVQVSTMHKLKGTYWPSKIGDDFAINFAGERMRPSGFKPDGTPIYKIEDTQVMEGLDMAWSTADGRTFVLGDTMYAPDGKTILWEYPDNYAGVHGSHRIGYDRPPGTLVGENHINGHFELNGEELFVVNGNHGDWFTFTSDGLLAACIFGGPLNYGKRFWTMPEWEPGKTDLSDLNVGEEHFFGSVTKANDGKVYAVAGHNHNSVVRVDGLESMKRLNGTQIVTKTDIEKTMDWEQQRVMQARLRELPKITSVPFLDKPLVVNGVLEDWPKSLLVTIHERLNIVKAVWEPDMQGAFAFDSDNLYVAARVSDDSPLKNSAQNLDYLYKNGDALDVCLGLDPKADPKRQTAAQGDIRLLISKVNGKNVVMLYRFQVADVPDEKRVHIISPITETVVDILKEIKGAEVATKIAENNNEWVIMAAIPWDEIGVKAPPVGSKIRGDIGVLAGDSNGMRTVSRYYWAGKSQTVVSDLAFEARIAPGLWGDLNVVEPDKSMDFGPDDAPF
ncbi:MAG: hypothetical protein WCO98_01985 [bacterium]